MPRCHITLSFVKSLQLERPSKRIMYMDADFRSLLLEVRPTGAGTWYFRYDSKGKYKLFKIGSMEEVSVLEAKAKAFELQHSLLLHGGELGLPGEFSAHRLTFSAFIHEHYAMHAKNRKRSWSAEQRILRREIMPIFGEMRLNAVTRFTVILWLEGVIGRGLAPSTCNRALFLLKYIFSCARRWGFIAESPAKDVSALPEREFRERYLSEKEACQLLDVLLEEKDQQAAHAIRLLLFTGARKSEILAARWENVDVERRLLTVPLSKSGKARHIPLSDAALQVLADLPQRSEWLFPSPRKDGHITSVFIVWDRVRTKAGLQDVRLHDLRHSFASFLVNGGFSLYEVQKILGHHNPKVTARYAHLTQESLLMAANAVGKRIEKEKRRKALDRVPVNKII